MICKNQITHFVHKIKISYEKGFFIMAEMMKRIVAKGNMANEIVEVEIPKIDDNQILVKLSYMGVCMSEHYGWTVAECGQRFGHEPMGVVVEVGKNITSVKVGDRVTGLMDGGMQEYIVTDVSRVFKVPDNITDVDAIGEPLACLVSAVSKVPLQYPGEDSVAVVGCGYMGCGAIGLLKARGVGKLVAVDTNPESLKNALKYGADEAYLPEELPENYLAVGNYWATGGFKYVMEWGETEASLDTAIRMTRALGFLGIGAYHTGGKRAVDVQMLNFKAIDMLSTHPRDTDRLMNSCRLAMDMLSSGLWNYKNVPTKVYPMDKFDDAHKELETKFGKYLKAVIDMNPEHIGAEPYIVE